MNLGDTHSPMWVSINKPMSTLPTHRRRFLRFRLRTLLLLPVLFAAGWWWATWPERTARRFVEFLAAGDIEAAKRMTNSAADGLWLLPLVDGVRFEAPDFVGVTWYDYAKSRRAFAIRWTVTSGRGVLNGFTTHRGVVALNPVIGASVLTPYSFEHVDPLTAWITLNEILGNRLGTRVMMVPASRIILIYATPAIHSQVAKIAASMEIPRTSREDPPDASLGERQSNVFRHPIYRPTEQPVKIIHPSP
jgi:hypothetical protein